MVDIIVVDDERRFQTPDDVNITYLTTAKDALYHLARLWSLNVTTTQVDIDQLWLDHDLGDGGSVTPIVDWLVALAVVGAKFPVRVILVHSQNPVGANNVVNMLKRHYKVVRATLPVLEMQ